MLALDLAGAEGLSTRLSFVRKSEDALRDADGLLLVTEWKEFRGFSPTAMRKLLRAPLVFDGRNQYDPQAMVDAGLEYFGVGRGTDKGRTHAPSSAETDE